MNDDDDSSSSSSSSSIFYTVSESYEYCEHLLLWLSDRCHKNEIFEAYICFLFWITPWQVPLMAPEKLYKDVGDI